MKLMSKIFLFLGVTVFLGGCRLAVIVVEGGEVRSTSSGTCLGGTICIVDVASPNFHESFEAIADRGWYFQKWNSGDRFFCGGSTNPICELSFKGYEESKEVGEMVESSEVFYLMPIFTETLPRPILDSDTITVNGREWAQVDLFTNLTWNDINTACPGGVCVEGAVLNGYSMTGWKWASIDDANALFNYYIGNQELGPGLDSYSDGRSDSEWATDFYDDGWRVTCSNPELSRATSGYVSEYPFTGHMTDFLWGEDNEYLVDGTGTGAGGEEEPEDCTGGWFYR